MATTTTFNHDKRNFLHQKLDAVIHLWARVDDGTQTFQFGLLDLDDVSGPEAQQHHCVKCYHTPK